MRSELSILIPSHNGEGTLPKLLAALEAQLCPGDELIVVDDGSTDATSRIAGTMGANVICNASCLGVAASRNILAQKSSGKVLVFFDDDVIPFPGYLDEVRRIFSDHGVDVCQGVHHVKPADDRPDLWQCCEALSWHYYMNEQIVESGSCHSLTSQAFCIRRELFGSLGGFTESFQGAGGEEFDFTLRLLMKSRIQFSPQLVTYHHFQSLFARLQTLWRRSRHYAGIYTRMTSALKRIHRVEFIRCLLFSSSVAGAVACLIGLQTQAVAWFCLASWAVSDWRYWRHAVRSGALRLIPALLIQRAGQYAVICAGAATRSLFR